MPSKVMKYPAPVPGPPPGGGHVHVQPKGQVRSERRDFAGDERLPGRQIQPPAVVLIGERGVVVTVANHRVAARQGGPDHLGQVLDAVGQVQQHLAVRRHRGAGAVQQEGAQAFADRRAAGLARFHHGDSLIAQLGRQAPRVIEGSSFDIAADLVIKALGFDPEDQPKLFGAPELPVTDWGTLKIDWRTLMTAIPGVFAAGDIVRGASLVVWAIRDGRDAAESINKYLQNAAQRVAAE